MQWSRSWGQRTVLSLGLICLLVGALPSLAAVTDAASVLGNRNAAFWVQAADDRALPAPTPPNIILVLTDDQEVSSLSLLQEQGTTFSRFFVSMAACCPSRVSILRGQYAHNHAVLSNVGEQGGFQRFYRLGGEDSTVATWLQEAGYRTAMLGRYLTGYPNPLNPAYVPPGWDEWASLLYRPPSVSSIKYELSENGRIVGYGDDPYQNDVLTLKATDFVRRSAADNRPFFAYIAPFVPHRPTIPAPRHAEAFADARAPRPPSFDEADITDKPMGIRSRPRLTDDQIAQIDELYRQRLRTLLAVDEMVASLIDTLRETGTLENTYVIFTSDNGHFLGEHRLPEGKGTPYEEAIRVPFVVRGPGVAAGRVEDRLTLNIDLAPTLAELAGVDVPDFVDGRSLAPLLRGERPNGWRRSFLVEGQDLRFRGLRTDDLLYVEYRHGERELYDLRSDPYQLENLAAASDPAVLAKLSAQLASLASCAAATCRAVEEAAVESVNVQTDHPSSPEATLEPVSIRTDRISTPEAAVEPANARADRTFTPDADARVLEAEPMTNFGDARILTVVGGRAPDAESYLRFAVRDLPGPVQRATLRLFVPAATDAIDTGTTDGPALFIAPNDWTEAGITWADRPTRSSEPYGDKGSLPAGAWVE